MHYRSTLQHKINRLTGSYSLFFILLVVQTGFIPARLTAQDLNTGNDSTISQLKRELSHSNTFIGYLQNFKLLRDLYAKNERESFRLMADPVKSKFLNELASADPADEGKITGLLNTVVYNAVDLVKSITETEKIGKKLRSEYPKLINLSQSQMQDIIAFTLAQQSRNAGPASVSRVGEVLETREECLKRCNDEFARDNNLCLAGAATDITICTVAAAAAALACSVLVVGAPACIALVLIAQAACEARALITQQQCINAATNQLNACIAACPAAPSVVPPSNPLITSTCDNGENLIIWETTSPVIIAGYDIQKSPDALTWSNVSSVNFSSGNATARYSFKDTTASVNSFYRVIGYQLNGRKFYTSTISSACNSSTLQNVLAFPNPANSSITTVRITSFKTTAVNLTIYNSQGNPVHSEQSYLFTGVNHLPVDLNKLTAGIYIITASSSDAVRTYKLIKN